MTKPYITKRADKTRGICQVKQIQILHAIMRDIKDGRASLGKTMGSVDLPTAASPFVSLKSWAWMVKRTRAALHITERSAIGSS